MKTLRSSIRLVIASVAVAFIFGMMVFACGAAEPFYYINSATGDDTASGTSASTAVKTYEQATALAQETGGTIVFTDEYHFSAHAVEPAHEKQFVLTSDDGTTDYSAAGAKMVFDGAYRYILHGNTTFRNIAIEYKGTLNCVANYNYINFADGVTTKNIGSGNGVYVVGGYQAPVGDEDATLDSHITIESGTFYVVIGGSRQKPSTSKEMTFTGTHHITVLGGDISLVYGACVSAHISKNSEIAVSGGNIENLYMGGDMTRKITGTATCTLSGGNIENLYTNNIIGSAETKLCGAKVGKAEVFCYNATLVNEEAKANKPKTLLYDAHYYSADEVEAMCTGYDAVVNITSIYAKDGATGSGESMLDPTSFTKAFAEAVEKKATIVVIGTINLNNFTETAHSAEIEICGYDGASVLNISGTYTLGGRTSFNKIKLSGSSARFDSQKGMLVIHTSDVTSPFDIKGSSELYSGTFGNITGGSSDMSVLVNGASVSSITGGNGKVRVEISNGKIGTVRTAETSVNDFELIVNGGSIDKVVFSNVKKSLSVLMFGGSISSSSVEGTNVKGKFTAGTSSYTAASLGSAASLFAESRADVIYVKDGQKGTGSSAFSPLGSISEAVSALGTNGGTIVVCGAVSVPAAYRVPAHNGKLTITSVGNGTDYKPLGAKLTFLGDINLGGKTEISDITLVCGKNNAYIYCNNFDVAFGEGITSQHGASVTTYMSICGGTATSMKNTSTNITVDSGDWQYMRGATPNSAENCTVNVTVNGGAFYGRAIITSVGSFSGTAHAYFNGGTFYMGVFLTDFSSGAFKMTGNADININGGTYYNVISPAYANLGTFSGTYTVNVNGGDFAHLVSLVGAEKLNGDMASYICAGSGVDFDAKEVGTFEFTNPISTRGADPWLFYHDGYYYYTSTIGNQILLYKATNIGDIEKGVSKTVYKPEADKPWSKSIWSPEIHYYSEEDFGAENAGWYCYIACDDGDNTNHRMYVIKCLSGDDLFGEWGNPVTGEVNVPILVTCTGDSNFANRWAAGQTDIRIGGKVYALYVTEEGRGTDDFHQTINIASLKNPWTMTGTPKVICRSTYDWEKGGWGDGVHPQVVEGGTAVYGDDGSIYIVYSGSGYWTTLYQLGQLKYKGGDPTDINNWEKLATPIFSKSDTINGCGHACYITDLNGQSWICYHAYIGKTATGGRKAFVEPYTATAAGVVIADGSKHPAELDTVYTVAVNPLPLADKIVNFESVTKTNQKFNSYRAFADRFADVTSSHWFYGYVANAYCIGLVEGTSQTKFSPDSTFTVAQALTAAAKIHATYNSKVIPTVTGGKWFDTYVDYCVANGIITATQFANYDANITRGEMATVFANILPDSEYTAVRSGSNPDVTSNMACYAAVQKLYNAGIVGGDEGTGNYRPNDSIKRSEACVIFTRIALAEYRAK